MHAHLRSYHGNLTKLCVYYTFVVVLVVGVDTRIMCVYVCTYICTYV